MKSSIAVLFTIWCVTLCAGAIQSQDDNVESVPIFEAWRNVFKRIGRYTDAGDHPVIQRLAASVNPIEKAYLAKDLKEIVKIYERILPEARSLLPHFKNKRLREVFSNSINQVEELVAKLKAPDAHIRHVKAFLRKIVAQSTILLKEILIEAENKSPSASH